MVGSTTYDSLAGRVIGLETRTKTNQTLTALKLSYDLAGNLLRREEKILAPDVLEGVTMLRRSLISMNQVEAMEQLIKTLAKYPTNADFLARIKQVL